MFIDGCRTARRGQQCEIRLKEVLSKRLRYHAPVLDSCCSSLTAIAHFVLMSWREHLGMSVACVVADLPQAHHPGIVHRW